MSVESGDTEMCLVEDFLRALFGEVKTQRIGSTRVFHPDLNYSHKDQPQALLHAISFPHRLRSHFSFLLIVLYLLSLRWSSRVSPHPFHSRRERVFPLADYQRRVQVATLTVSLCEHIAHSLL